MRLGRLAVLVALCFLVMGCGPGMDDGADETTRASAETSAGDDRQYLLERVDDAAVIQLYADPDPAMRGYSGSSTPTERRAMVLPLMNRTEYVSATCSRSRGYWCVCGRRPVSRRVRIRPWSYSSAIALWREATRNTR